MSTICLPHSLPGRSARTVGTVLCLGLLCLGGRNAAAASLTFSAGEYALSAEGYEAVVSPARGGRIVALRHRGANMTDAAGPLGGLAVEQHTADTAYEVLSTTSDPGSASLVLAASAGQLRVVKQFIARDDEPWLTVRMEFENHGPWPLSGADAPAVRNRIALADNHALHSMDRGRGAETVSSRLLPVAVSEGIAQSNLRWLAVSDPRSRRVLAFLPGCPGCRLLRPLQTGSGGLSIGWRYPTIPAGHCLTADMKLIPLEGFTAVSELNRQFVADTLPAPKREPLSLRFSLLPLSPHEEVSVVTRAYATSGAELEPCPPLVFTGVDPMVVAEGRIECPDYGGQVAGFVHEVYGGERRIGRCVVPVDGMALPTSLTTAPAVPAYKPLPIRGDEAEGVAALTRTANERGFGVWLFDGTASGHPLEAVSVALGVGERRTLFLRVRAAHDLPHLNFAVGGESGTESFAPLSASAVYLWLIHESAPGAGRMLPYQSRAVAAGEDRWLALTLDASRLAPGRHVGRLVISAEAQVVEAQLDVRVSERPSLAEDSFGLWYIGDGEPVSAAALPLLTSHGVDAVALGMSTYTPQSLPQQIRLVARKRADGALPPEQAAGGSPLLPYPSPLWLLRESVVDATTVAATHQSGYQVALLTRDLTSEAPAASAYLVNRGVPAGLVPELTAAGMLDPDDTVWLHLDLADMDWRRAALPVRRAAWAAAWQGLSGLAVSCQAPTGAVDRQWALWHVIRDACAEARLWSQARRLARSALKADTGSPERQAKVLALNRVQAIVGPEANYLLPLAADPAVGRGVLTVRADSLRPFREAHRRTLQLLQEIAAFEQQLPRCAVWHGVPLTQNGQHQWSVVGLGDEGQNLARRFAQGFETKWERPLPVASNWQDAVNEAPKLVWVFTDAVQTLPESLEAAVRQRGMWPLALTRADGALVALVRPDVSAARLLDTVVDAMDLYATAGEMR